MPEYQVKIYDGMSYRKRQAAANKDGAICFIAIHHNGFKDPDAKGAMVIVARNASETSRELARAWMRKNHEITGVPMRRGPAGDLFYWAHQNGNRGESQIKYTAMPAILTEGLFLTNPDEAALALSEEGQKKLALAIAEAIREIYPEGGLVALSPGHNAGIQSNLYGSWIYGHPTDSRWAPETGEVYEYHVNRTVADAVAEELGYPLAVVDPELARREPDRTFPIGKVGDTFLTMQIWREGETGLDMMVVETDEHGDEINSWEIDTEAVGERA